MIIIRDKYPGIDIGSVSVTVAVTDEQSSIISSSYAFHNDLTNQNLLRTIEEYDEPKT